MQEAYVQGVSMRSVDELVKAMGMSGISKSQVSRLCGDIDERVHAFLDRPLEGDWPYLWIDATYVKCREAEPFWTDFMRHALAHAGKGQRQVVLAAINTVFVQQTFDAASALWRVVADQLRAKVPQALRADGPGGTRRARVHDLPQDTSHADPRHQSAREGQCRDQAAHRHRWHLPQCAGHHALGRRIDARAER
jgi:transposase-like protein